MSHTSTDLNTEAALDSLEKAGREEKITAAAAANVKIWLTEPRYAEYARQVAQLIADEQWQQLDDIFWTIIPFGTGGRRGRMFPVGTNAINTRTIGESAQGLADYVKSQAAGEGQLSCAIAYDTRHKSREFAELCAGVMAAAGMKVYFLDGYRSTPELSFLVRYKKCDCGVMVTASHNPPSYNAVKVYWSDGAQVTPPHDKAVIEQVGRVEDITCMPFAEAIEKGLVDFCQEEVDAAFTTAVLSQATPGPREVKIIYSPLHGVGESAVCPVLAADGFEDVEVFGPHAEPNGDFPNVPNHVSNPENPAVFDAIISRARETGAELILATDPDCDRLGCAAPLTANAGGAWRAFTGNQIAVLLADYVLEQRRGSLSREHYLVTTLVSTGMLRRIGDSYGVTTYDDLLVGFKWIAKKMDEAGPGKFVFGAEESHGYLVGQYARDKDAAVACMLMAELAAGVKSAGQSLHEKLDSLYWQHGYHAERLLNQQMEGSEGMQKMQTLMSRFRSQPPESLGGLKVAAVRDYQNSQITRGGAAPEPLVGPVNDLVILDLAEAGNYVAVRPSGTEPKVKFYMFTYTPAEMLADLDQTREAMDARLTAFEQDLKQVAAST